MRTKWTQLHTLLSCVFIVALVVVGLRIFPWPLAARDSGSALTTWCIVMGIITLLVITAGHGITGKLFGALIDERNRISLSRLQLAIWTIVILSAYTTAVAWNFTTGKSDPLVITLPTEVWLLLGISTASLVGSPLILSGKPRGPIDQAQERSQLELEAARRGIQPEAARRGTQPEVEFKSDASLPGATFVPDQQLIEDLKKRLKIDTRGSLVVNATSANASLSNLFVGDEVGNFVQVDLSKLQMLLFTLILVVGYVAAIAAMFTQPSAAEGITAFPAVDPSMVALLGVSTTGYLAYKAVPHTNSVTP